MGRSFITSSYSWPTINYIVCMVEKQNEKQKKKREGEGGGVRGTSGQPQLISWYGSINQVKKASANNFT